LLLDLFDDRLLGAVVDDPGHLKALWPLIRGKKV
jgi:hypothetical protein